MSGPFEEFEKTSRRPPKQARIAREDDRMRPSRGGPRVEGVLPRAQVRLICFVVLTACLLLCGTLTLLSIWGVADEWLAWRAIATLVTIAFMAGVFTVLNEVFGRKIPTDAT